MSARPRGRPRAEPSAVQRRRVLDVARERFVELGYDEVTVAGVAERAGVTRAVVYEVVGDKAALVAAVAAETAADFERAAAAQLVATAGRPLHLPDMIDEQVRWFLDTLVGDRTMRVLLAMSSRLETASPAVAAVRRSVEDVLTAFYAEVAAGFGVRRGPGARLVAVAVLSLVEAVALRPEVDAEWPLAETAAVVSAFVTGAVERLERAGGALDAFDAAVGTAGGASPAVER